MTTTELIQAFIYNDATSGSASNLYIENNTLINYSTAIAYRAEDKFYINNDYYSPTTSRNQNQLKRFAEGSYELVTENKLNEIISKNGSLRHR